MAMMRKVIFEVSLHLESKLCHLIAVCPLQVIRGVSAPLLVQCRQYQHLLMGFLRG